MLAMQMPALPVIRGNLVSRRVTGQPHPGHIKVSTQQVSRSAPTGTL
jgi:hypothetical protein